MKLIAEVAYDPAVPARKLDFFFPEDNTSAPLILMIHGGGWISGDKSMYHEEAVWYTRQGYAAACIGYRLAPLHPFPAAIADIQAALKFCRENQNNLPYDKNVIVTIGNSAGAHLSCMAGLLDRNIETGESIQPANGFIAIAPITDIRNPDETQYPIAMSFLEQFMGSSHFEKPEDYVLASPIVHVSENSPPSLIVHGDQDDIVPITQSEMLYNALCQAGAASELHILPNEGHAYTLEAWTQIRELALDFLKTI